MVLVKTESNVPIDGNLIKEKAIIYAKELDYNKFHSSAGLLDRWNKKVNAYQLCLFGDM